MRKLKPKAKKIEKITKLRNKYTQDLVFTSDFYPTKFIDGKNFIAIFADIENRRIMYTNPEGYEVVK